MLDFYENVAIGARIELGSWRFTPDDIVRYARQYDPQRFHLSEEAAAKTHFGRLCASGWHTACVCMKLTVARRADAEAAARAQGATLARLGGSPGFKGLRWIRPVFANDVIAYSMTVTQKRLSASMPEWGILSFLDEGVNQAGEKVFEFNGTCFIERREKGR